MSKQAVALLVHQNPSQVNALIKILSHDFDIYIHIDRKSRMQASELHNKKTWKEIEVKWGGFGMVEATMLLYRKILAAGIPYTHIILLSGDTLPVKTPSFISQFLGEHDGISFLENNKAGELTLERRRLVWYNADFRKQIKGWRTLLYPLLFVRALQRKLKIYRSTSGFERTGSQWTILAIKHVQHLLDHCRVDKYRTVAVPDESFVQDHFFNNNIPHRDNLIYAHWGTPRGYSPDFIDETVYHRLKSDKFLFARKFRPDFNYEAESESASSR